MPKSRIKNSPRAGAIEKKREGENLAVVIEDVRPDERKMTLAPGDTRDEAEWKNYAKGPAKAMGSLGEKLKQAMEAKKNE